MSQLAKSKSFLKVCLETDTTIDNIPTQYTSPSYRCSKCGVTGVILWHALLFRRDTLSCTECATNQHPKKVGFLKKQRYNTADNIGPFKPAIWNSDGNYYPSDFADAGAIRLWQTLPKKL